MFDFLRSMPSTEKRDVQDDAVATSSNHTPKILKSIFSPQTPSPSPQPPPTTRQFSDDSSDRNRACTPVPKCSPVKNKLRKPSSLRNLVKADESGADSPSKSVIGESTEAGEMSMAGTAFGEAAQEGKDKSLIRKRSGSLRDKARALVRRLSFSEERGPDPAEDEVPPVPEAALFHSASVPVALDFAFPQSLTYAPKSSPYGTPNRASFRGILKEQEAPGSGNSVRFGSRNQTRLITPNTTTEGSFMDALESSPSSTGSASPSTVAPAAFLAKLHSASLSDDQPLAPDHASAGVNAEAGPSRPSALHSAAPQPRSTGSTFDADAGAFDSGASAFSPREASSSPGLASSVRLSPSIGHGRAHTGSSRAGPNNTLTSSPDKHASYSHTELLSMDMGDVPADMSNLMDTLSRIGDATSERTTDPTGWLAGSPADESPQDVSRTSTDVGRTPMPRRWLRHDSPPSRQSASERSSPRWTLPAMPEESSSSNHSSPNTSRHSDCIRVHDVSADASGPRQENDPETLDPGGSLTERSTDRSITSARTSSPPLGDISGTTAQHPQTPPRDEVTVWATPMTTMRTEFSILEEVPSPDSSSEELGQLGSSADSRKLIGLGQTVLEASEQYAQVLVKKNAFLEELAQKLAAELKERDLWIQQLQVHGQSRTAKAPADSRTIDSLVRALESDYQLVLGRRTPDTPDVGGGDKDTVHAKLAQTEAELRDAEIRLEAMQQESRASADKENGLRVQVEDLRDQLERARADKSVMYHHGVEEEIKLAMQRDAERPISTPQRDREITLADVERDLSRRVSATQHDESIRGLEAALEQLKIELGNAQQEKDVTKRALDQAQRELHDGKTHWQAEAQRHGEELVQAREQSEREIERLQAEVSDSQQAATEAIDRAEQANEDQRCAQMRLDSVTQALAVAEEAIDNANDELSRKEEDVATERTRSKEMCAALQSELEQARQEMQQQAAALSDLERKYAEVITGRNDVSTVAQEELARLRQEVAQLRSQSANQEVQVVQLRKAKAQLKEDREMLNIALDAKQQELELMKRRFSVRGIAGATPVASRTAHDMTGSGIQNTPAPSRSYSKRLDATPARSSLHAYVTPSVSRRMDSRPSVSSARLPERKISSALSETSRHNALVEVTPPAAETQLVEKRTLQAQPAQTRARTRSQRDLVPA